MGSTQRGCPALFLFLFGILSTAACLLSLWGITAQPPGPTGAAEVTSLPWPGQCVQGPASPAVTNTAQIAARAGTLARTFHLGVVSQGRS